MKQIAGKYWNVLIWLRNGYKKEYMIAAPNSLTALISVMELAVDELVDGADDIYKIEVTE